jgi:hypothetical protein
MLHYGHHKTRLTFLSDLLLPLSVLLLSPSAPSQTVGILGSYNNQRQKSNIADSKIYKWGERKPKKKSTEQAFSCLSMKG